MSSSIEELARTDTELGELVLRRRFELVSRQDIFEVFLAGDGLMSSLFTHGEEQLVALGLAALGDTIGPGTADVVVGGLGLGYSARTVLRDERVRSLQVVDTLDVVIDWHRRHLVPLGAELTGDARCTLVHGDFFTVVDQAPPMLPGGPAQFDAILVDIDHSPRHLLDPSHATLYTPSGLERLARHLRPARRRLPRHGEHGLRSGRRAHDQLLELPDRRSHPQHDLRRNRPARLIGPSGRSGRLRELLTEGSLTVLVYTT